MVDQIVEVNEQIWEVRPVSALAGTLPQGWSKTRGLFAELQAEFSAEVERISQLAARLFSDPSGKDWRPSSWRSALP